MDFLERVNHYTTTWDSINSSILFFFLATPKALKKIETVEREKGEELSKWEKVKIAGPSYVPAVMNGAATVTCVIGANLLTSRRQANIASAYALVNESYKQYQNKVREIYGDLKE